MAADAVMSVRQAAMALGTSPWKVRTMLATGALRGVKRISASGHERLEVAAASVAREQAKQKQAAA
jgi:hypothetical protein